jgi:hypothetical protein
MIERDGQEGGGESCFPHVDEASGAANPSGFYAKRWRRGLAEGGQSYIFEDEPV